jgi:DNA processing protein
VTSTRYALAFNLVPHIGPAKAQRLLDHFGDLETAWRANHFDLAAAGLDKRALDNLLATRQQIDLDAELEKVERAGATLVALDDPNYPRLLKQIHHAPFLLYVKGAMMPDDEWALAVVGTRRATAYGREATRSIVTDLVRNRITIVSGLARGIDAEAHHTALEHHGRTLAVLGCGVDVIYPPEHKKLAQAIIENGALISEYPLGTLPEAGNFPPRNRIISGLSMGTLIVEGDESTGARITIEYALEQGRETFAVPGNIFHRESRGTNKMIQRGEVKLVTSAIEILEELNLSMIEEQQEVRAALPANETEAALLKHLSADPLHVDELCRETQLPAATVSSTLTMMELKGLVRQVGGMQYVIAREETAKYAVDE